MSESTTIQWITIFVRFNDDGSSDHIRVLEDKLLSYEHFDKSPIPRFFSNGKGWCIQAEILETTAWYPNKRVLN